MIDNVHVPAFFEKLASLGIQPKTQAEATQLLQLGAVLAQAEADGQTKQAQDGNPFLNHVLQRATGRPQGVNIDQMIKNSADSMIAADDDGLAQTASLVYAHAVTGGELAE